LIGRAIARDHDKEAFEIIDAAVHDVWKVQGLKPIRELLRQLYDEPLEE
jgi:hypothetical protein